MKKSLTAVVLILAVSAGTVQAGTSFAGRVVSYDPSTASESGYTNPEAALGQIAVDTGWGATTPFNMPFTSDDFVTIGEGGHLTLELENYLLPGDGFELGVFSYQMFYQDGWPDGGTTDPVDLFRPTQMAVVEVSEGGSDWYALNGGDRIQMDMPAAAYSDAEATIESDFSKPFTVSLSDFDGLGSVQEVLDVFDGSAGGTWLDVSEAGLDRIGYVRFTVPYGDAFELEAVSIASGAIGAAVPEPLSILLLGTGACFLRRRSS
ncbi:hypothetical protein STSP2_01714 [Anaerohalosphaera lusitana]|uniref:PEP-CTERM protein-sorting domain-containing protein n=1 Tax=Anaerohalosphaera lusitana TaxID=1936003 RepID=A0A1U9NL70_9BACT|nr:PEP-CTERM sorting domain-containing protein [Anaerohalosphaera lusitana]AQT68547.1 hypothetical protein STSP2_01714 [Anaerohalosphaera lusitana]